MWFKGKSGDATDGARPNGAATASAPITAPMAAPVIAPEVPADAAAAPQSGPVPLVPELPAEEARARALNAKLVAASFGEIVTLLMRAPGYQAHTLKDLEWLIVPAIMTGQFAIVDAQAKSTGVVSPVGTVLWAMVSPEIDARLSQDLEQPVRLQPAEWRTGPIPWIVMTIGDPQVVGTIMRQLATSVFKGEPARVRTRDAEGRLAVGRVSVSPPAAAPGPA